jgi:copper chaperone
VPAVLRADGRLGRPVVNRGDMAMPGSLQSSLESQMEQLSIKIAGMSCAGCPESVRHALTRLPGVQVRRVDVDSASVIYDASVTSPELMRSAIVKAGYKPHQLS